MNNKKVIVWGNGNFYREHEKQISDEFSVVAIVDTYNIKPVGNVMVDTPTIIKYLEYDYVLIMIADIKNVFDVINKLHDEYGVKFVDILLGVNRYGKNDDFVTWGEIDSDGHICIEIGGISLKIGSFNEFYNVVEVLRNKVYSYCINNGKKDVIIDVGMNIGDSTLFFLQYENVYKVYAYEPFDDTYDRAMDNLKEYCNDTRLNTFCYGLSDINEDRVIGFNKNMPCAQSTIMEVREKAHSDFLMRGLIQEDDERMASISVVEASAEMSRIFDDVGDEYNIIMKIDCEGEEYRIIDNMYESGILKRIDFIMMEWHYHGNEELLDKLKKSGFSYWHSYKNADMGQIYAYKQK